MERSNLKFLRLFMVGWVVLIGGLLFCLLPATVQARPVRLPLAQGTPTSTPAPETEKDAAVPQLRRVKVNFFINSISHVNNETGTYDLDCYLDFYWLDPALEGKRVEDMDPKTLWDPLLEPINSLDYKLLGRKYTNSLEPRTNVRLSYRLVGVFHTDFDLRKFPFDRQVFTFQLESSEFDSSQMLFDFIDNDSPTIYGDQPIVNSVARGKYLVPDFQIPEWTVNDLRIVQQIRVLPYDKSSWAQFRVDLPATRQSGSYVWRVIVEMMILLVFCWGVLFLESQLLRYRLLVLCVLFMVTVLFNFLLQQNQPSTPYLTFPDHYMLLAYSAIGLLGVTVVVIKWLHERSQDALALRVNNLARLIYPVLVFVVNGIIFWYVLS
jgi:Neurotransmitter-gated ion-channel ligand binding domain